MSEQAETTVPQTYPVETAPASGPLHLVRTTTHGNPLGALPASLAVTGLLTLLVGAWAGIVLFVGPTFGYSPDGSSAWTWSTNHLVSGLAPGAAAVLVGLLILGAAPATVVGLGRLRLSLAGLLAIAAGGWLAIAPLAWPVLEGSSRYFNGGSPFRELVNWGGSALGPGLLIVAFGGFAMGWARRHVAVEPVGVAAAV